MLFNRRNRSRKSHWPVKPIPLPARRNAARLWLEALEQRVVPAFLDAVNYAAGSGPQAVITGDFNNDTVVDVAVTNYSSETVSVLLGNADGTFQPAISSPAGNHPISLAVGDFNADGTLDLATVGTYFAFAGYPVAAVLLGNGNGTFRSSTQILLGSTEHRSSSVAVGDFNADGKLDLCVTIDTNTDYGNPGFADVAVLLGTGTGDFSSSVGSNIGGYTPTSAAVSADLDANGKLDIALVSEYGGYLGVGMGNGDGSFLQFTFYYFNFDFGLPTSLVATDLNNDGKVDLATARYGGVSVLLGDGLGSFGSPQTFAAGSRPGSLAAADFNGDGAIDLITTNANTGAVSVLLGTGNGALQPPVNPGVGSTPFGVAVGDFNGDGWMDAATANSASHNLSVLLNDGVWPAPSPPSISINDVTLAERNTGTSAATFTVRLSAVSGQPVTVSYSTANGSAAAGSDFQPISGTLTFAPGETSKIISILVNGDRLGEPNEAFVVNLSSPTNADIADGQGVGTILDDEPRISITDVSLTEGGNGQTTLFTFTVTLSVAYDQPVTISFRTANGSPKKNEDYVGKSGSLTFAPGETTKTITIVVNGDSKKEADETFYLDLFGNSSNSLVTKSRGIGTILNDD